MQAIGYKEIAMYLHGKITLDEAIRLIKRGTQRDMQKGSLPGSGKKKVFTGLI